MVSRSLPLLTWITIYFLFIYYVDAWLFFIFFFSSRRRHTRCSRDWSSDVCSSDLPELPLGGDRLPDIVRPRTRCERDESVLAGKRKKPRAIVSGRGAGFEPPAAGLSRRR